MQLTFARNYTLKRHLLNIHKVNSGTSDRIAHYKDHFMTRVNETHEDKVDTQMQVKEEKYPCIDCYSFKLPNGQWAKNCEK